MVDLCISELWFLCGVTVGRSVVVVLVFFFCNETTTTEIYTYCHTLSLHDALPISWNGRSFPELEQDPRWRDWNRSRSTSATPGGETMGGAVARTVRHLETVARENTGATILCVTHCDIIRGTIAHYPGPSLDNLLRFEVDPGDRNSGGSGKRGVGSVD